MRYARLLLFQLCFLPAVFAQNAPNIITTDIDNFWAAYDQIITTKDNARQLELLNELFIEKGTVGLREMMKARRYTAQEYVDAINQKPAYWASIRANTGRARDYAGEIEAGIEKLRLIYPELKPADIYFTVGVFRSGGTTSGNNILIGSEMIFADENLMRNLAFTNVHEYVHTQQKTTICDNLLGQSVMEGVAEFLAVKAMNQSSTAPAMDFGKRNEPRIKSAFARQMFNAFTGYWLYSNAKNEFGTRDLGYYVGYAIAERYYEKAKDKNLAVKQMIELNYNDPSALAKYVDASGYFPESVGALKKNFERSRPRVLRIKEFKNGSRRVSPLVDRLTVEFSTKMNDYYRNFQFGPLGKENTIKIKKVVGYSEDGKLLTIEIEPLEPNKHYQMVIGENFRDPSGVSLKPYLIDITTNTK